MKIELPVETWTEVFGFVPRSQLKKLVPHIGETRKRDRRGRKCQQTIGDRQFVSFIQFFLHKFGEVTLGEYGLLICPPKDGNEPIIIVYDCEEDEELELPLAIVPIPKNVKDFKSIIISYLDESVITFLQKFQRNSLLTNVNLYFCDCPNLLLQMMSNFLPITLFTNVNSIEINSSNSDVLDQLQNEYSELALPMLTSALVLITCYNCRDIWFCDWLHIPREDGKPRVLFLHGCQDDRTFSSSYFIKHIKKDFVEAKQAVSFFIKLEYFRDAASVQSLTLENSQTQEILVITGNTRYVWIWRYPMGTSKEEWRKDKNFADTHNRTIEFNIHP